MSIEKITCIAADDEPWALSLITEHIKKVPFLELVFETTEALAALHYLQRHKVQLVFMDIQMPELTGMQVIKILQNKIPVILTTAYSEFALEGYEHNVVDYLLKPISFERFYKAAEKASVFLQNNKVPKETLPANAANYLFVKTDSKMVRVNFDELLFVEGLKDYIAIHTLTDKLITLQNLKTMEDDLPAAHFMRVHKSYIVSLAKIDSIERNRIFIGGHSIPVGETFKEDFFKRINKGS